MFGVCCSLNLSAQGFLRYFTADSVATQTYSLCLKDSFFVVEGAVSDTVIAGGVASFVAKFDYNGNKISCNTYRDSRYLFFDFCINQNALINTSDGGMAAIGEVLDTAGKYLILFSKFDSAGGLLFYKTYDLGLSGYRHLNAYSIMERLDAYYITGDVQLANYYTEPLLVKLDLAGNLIFSKAYTTLDYVYTYQSSIKALQNGNLLVCVSRADNNINEWQNTLQTCFLEVDTLGNIKKQGKTTDNNTSAAYTLDIAQDKSYLSCGSYFKYREQGFTYEYQEYLAKWDTSFNKVWSLQVGDSGYNNNFSDFKQTASDEIILCGTNCNDINQTSPTGCLAKVNSNGDLQWYRKYIIPTGLNPDYSYSYLYNVGLLPCGDILAAGSWQNNGGNSPLGYQQVAWILRVDSNGCMEDGRCGLSTDISSSPALQVAPEAIKVVPNPSNGIFTINALGPLPSATTIEIYDALGRKLHSQALFNCNSLVNLYYLPSGIYFYKVGNGLINVGEGKLIIQK